MTVDGPTKPPAGWYADPHGAHATRWWNGQAWTEHLVFAAPPRPIPRLATIRRTSTLPPAGSKLRPTEAIAHVLANYAQFRGRASRSEYWWWYLSVSTAALGALLLDSFATFGILSIVLLAGTVVPSLAVTVRRLRDSGHDWPYLLLAFAPIANVMLLVFLCTPSVGRPRKVKQLQPTFAPPVRLD